MANYVIYSSVGHPENAIVQRSINLLGSSAETLVITSQEFSKNWEDIATRVQLIDFNSTSTTRVFIRKFILRSSILRLVTRSLLKFLPIEKRHLLMQPHTARHFEYLRALRSLNPNDWAIMVDSRDLIFQVDPNELINGLNSEEKIHLFKEDGLYFKDGSIQTNDHSKGNWNWALQVCNGNSTKVESLRGKEIINAGCIVGRVSDLIEFFYESCRLLANSLHSPYALLDQASVNLVAYDSKLSSRIQIHFNADLVINMCGIVQNKEISLEEGRLHCLNDVIPVVHQFDRFGSWSEASGLEFSKREYKVQN